MCFLPKSRHTRNRMLSADISRKVFGRITGNEVDSGKKEREDTIMFKGLFDLLVGFAAVLDVPPSWWILYEPKKPQALKNK